jgi:hypothetical protein
VIDNKGKAKNTYLFLDKKLCRPAALKFRGFWLFTESGAE